MTDVPKLTPEDAKAFVHSVVAVEVRDNFLMPGSVSWLRGELLPFRLVKDQKVVPVKVRIDYGVEVHTYSDRLIDPENLRSGGEAYKND